MHTINFILATAAKEGVNWVSIIPTSTIVSIISTVITIMVTTFYHNQRHKQDMLDKLDSKSGWRKELFELSFKSKYTIEDAYKFLSFLRFQPKKHSDLTFDIATLLMHDVCSTIIKLDKHSQKIELDNPIYNIHKNIDYINIHIENKSELQNNEIDYSIINDFTKYLLAHQWEYLQLKPKEQKSNKHQKKNAKYCKKEKELFIYIYDVVNKSSHNYKIPKEVSCHYNALTKSNKKEENS